MTKTMSQDNTDTDNEGTDDNNIDEKDNHHKMMTGMEMETYNNNHMTKTVVAVHDRG